MEANAFFECSRTRDCPRFHRISKWEPDHDDSHQPISSHNHHLLLLTVWGICQQIFHVEHSFFSSVLKRLNLYSVRRTFWPPVNLPVFANAIMTLQSLLLVSGFLRAAHLSTRNSCNHCCTTFTHLLLSFCPKTSSQMSTSALHWLSSKKQWNIWSTQSVVFPGWEILGLLPTFFWCSTCFLAWFYA